ncbi:MAG TPA: tryptophan--tRNA ligase [Candidatus Sulfotelmatobacter sp.]|nr:tryptophan--tRNA ligase [Candidatus Sulfotelmatobacter sp.]
MSKVVFSGIQPSGNLHIGNYIGAISQWVAKQDSTESIFCIVDLHAITLPQDPVQLREKVLEVAALYLACGINPEKSHIFVQSENPNHPYLAWILNTITPFGQLERMTQFKEKGDKHEANAGLFDYPVLMAADILLYQTDEVPVGEDQKQHIELTRDLAEKFNKKFGETFKLPAPVISKEAARIMSLQNLLFKMSKSDNDQLGTINLLDSEEEIREKIKKAVTDSGSKISKDASSEGLSNLLIIYSAFKGQDLEKTYDEVEGKSYGDFKTLLADLVSERLLEIQKKYKEIRSNEARLRKILDEGRDFAIGKSSETLGKVKEKVGL